MHILLLTLIYQQSRLTYGFTASLRESEVFLGLDMGQNFHALGDGSSKRISLRCCLFFRRHLGRTRAGGMPTQQLVEGGRRILHK